MTGEIWTDERLSMALRATDAATVEPGTDQCVDADVFCHLVRGELGGKLTHEILDHAAGCPPCLLALRLARAVAPAEASNVSMRRRLFPVALLSPAAALAYLVLLVLSVPLYLLLSPAPPAPGPVVAARPAPAPEMPAVAAVAEGLRGLRLLQLSGELSLRGGAKPEPAHVALSPGEAIALKIFPDLEELPRDPHASLTIRVLENGQERTAVQRRVGDLEADESFLVLLDAALLQPGRTYTAELRVESPAPRVILAQTFRIDAR